MDGGSRLIVVAAVVFVAAGAAKAARYEERVRSAELQLGPPKSLPARQSDISADYAGSAACQRCHDTEHAQWARSLHIKMTKPVADALIVGDFNGASLSDHGRAYKFDTRDGKPVISISHAGRPYESFNVQYTLGAKRFQGYLSTLPDGRIYVLPAFWNVAQKRWVDWKEITPVPDGAHDLRQIWNVTCFNCHATNLAQNFDVTTKKYNTTWTEMGLGCETCHGPGKPHIALMEEWEKNPSTRPVYDKRASNRDLGRVLRIFSPRSGDPRQVFDMCAYCHGNKSNVFLGFRPGDRMEDFALPFLVSQPMPADDPQGEFWPDGRASRFNRPQALTLSGCFLKGKVTCTDCHVAHGSRHEHSLKVAMADSNRLCTQCHEGLTAAPALAQHTHHPATSAGSRCVDCHMSDVNWRLLVRRRDHTFAAPVPEMTAKYGSPNACTQCHDDRSPEWAIGAMDRWYGDDDRERRMRAMGVANALYLAGAGDTAALPALATLAIDRSQGLLVRGSAAEYIGQLYVVALGGGAEISPPGPSQTSLEGAKPAAAVPKDASARGLPAMTPELRTRLVNALIGAAADPEPTVRAAAVRSLGYVNDRRALMPIVARLQDETRVVRTIAAEGLLRMGVYTLPGQAADVLMRAQDELAAALATFPDTVNNHVTLGWLESERGRQDAATRALDTALQLDATYPRAHVYKGLVSARTGQYGEAIRHWETAKKLDPGYPNLDRLIEEARKRTALPRP